MKHLAVSCGSGRWQQRSPAGLSNRHFTCHVLACFPSGLLLTCSRVASYSRPRMQLETASADCILGASIALLTQKLRPVFQGEGHQVDDVCSTYAPSTNSEPARLCARSVVLSRVHARVAYRFEAAAVRHLADHQKCCLPFNSIITYICPGPTRTWRLWPRGGAERDCRSEKLALFLTRQNSQSS